MDNAVYGGDETKQYHLMTDASLHAIGGVLLQLPNTPSVPNGPGRPGFRKAGLGLS